MIFPTFIRLLETAEQSSDAEVFIAECGWQSWMDKEGTPEDVADILSLIFEMSRATLSELRERIEISNRAKFSRTYRIPLRSIENWESEKSTTFPYTKNLLYYSIFIHIMEGEDGYLDEQD